MHFRLFEYLEELVSDRVSATLSVLSRSVENANDEANHVSGNGSSVLAPKADFYIKVSKCPFPTHFLPLSSV